MPRVLVFCLCCLALLQNNRIWGQFIPDPISTDMEYSNTCCDISTTNGNNYNTS